MSLPNLISHDAGEESILPLSGGGVDIPEQFVVCHGFRVQVSPHGLPLQVLVGAVENATRLCFTCTRVSDNEDGVPNRQQLLELYYL